MDEPREAQVARILYKLRRNKSIALGRPCRVQEVESAERQLGIRLPDAYRCFLLNIGNGGKLYYYRLYSLSESLSQMDGLPSRVFPFVGLQDADLEAERGLLADREDYGLDGAVRIYHGGCTMYDLLVITGSQAGTLWFDGREDGTRPIPYVWPLTEPRGKQGRLDFLDWFGLRIDDFQLRLDSMAIDRA